MLDAGGPTSTVAVDATREIARTVAAISERRNA